MFGNTNAQQPQQQTAFGSLGGGSLFGTGGNAGLSVGQSPFGIITASQTSSPEQQRELLRQQLLGCGIDLNTLPVGFQTALQRIENPSMRTLQMVVKFIQRLQSLRSLSDRNDELITFVYNRAPNAEVAVRLQAPCDELAANLGSVAIQRLNRVKKMAPKEPRSEYYTKLVYGFQGLQERIATQADFFQCFAATLTQLKDRQKKSQEDFQTQAVESLQRLRRTQCELRERAINLMGALNELVVKNQGFDPEEEDVNQVRDAYERIIRQLKSSDGLVRQVPLLSRRVAEVRSGIQSAAAESRMSAVPKTQRLNVSGWNPFGNSTSRLDTGRRSLVGGSVEGFVGGSNDKKDTQEELFELAKRHNEEVENIKKRMETLQADMAELMAAHTSVF